MNVLDIVAITIIGFLVFKGFMKGLIAEVLGVASVILSVVVAVTFVEPFAKILVKNVSFLPGIFVPIVSFLILLIGTYVIGILIIKFLTHMAETMALGMVNRILGAGIGLFKGVLIVSLVIFLFSFVLPENTYKKMVKEDPIVAFCEPVVPATYRMIKKKEFPMKSPKNIRKWLRKIEGVQKKVVEESTKAVKEKVEEELKKND
jgi:membrane protein required for colicin V production